MNLKLIINSEKYKYFKKSLKEMIYIYLGFFTFFSILGIIMYFINESLMILSVVIVVFVSLFSFPFIIYYGYKLKKMANNESSYILMKGEILRVISKRIKYSRITEIVIYVKYLDKTFKTRVYEKNAPLIYFHSYYVEFLYNERSKDIIVIKSFKELKADSDYSFEEDIEFWDISIIGYNKM